jgi:hypothetical protein
MTNRRVTGFPAPIVIPRTGFGSGRDGRYGRHTTTSFCRRSLAAVGSSVITVRSSHLAFPLNMHLTSSV